MFQHTTNQICMKQSNTMFRGLVSLEDFLGVVTSIGASVVIAITTYLFAQSSSYALNIIVPLGHILGYALDIVFAKRSFMVNGTLTNVPYNHVLRRTGFLLKSFYSTSAIRFLVAVAVDTMIATSVYKWVKQRFKGRWLGDSKSGGVVITTSLACLTYVAYVNYSRFSWAYSGKTNPFMDFVMGSWLVITALAKYYAKSDRLVVFNAALYTLLLSFVYAVQSNI